MNRDSGKSQLEKVLNPKVLLVLLLLINSGTGFCCSTGALEERSLSLQMKKFSKCYKHVLPCSARLTKIRRNFWQTIEATKERLLLNYWQLLIINDLLDAEENAKLFIFNSLVSSWYTDTDSLKCIGKWAGFLGLPCQSKSCKLCNGWQGLQSRKTQRF